MIEDKNPNLENKAVFVKQDQTFGLPTRVFIGALFLAGFAAFVFFKYLGVWMGLFVSIAVGLVILVPSYLIHQEDPDAYIVWLRGLFAPTRRTTVTGTRRRVVVLAPHAGGTLKPKPLSEGNQQ